MRRSSNPGYRYKVRPPRYACWFKQAHESYGSIPHRSILIKGKFARNPHISWNIYGFRLRFSLEKNHKSPTVNQVMCVNLTVVWGPHPLWICQWGAPNSNGLSAIFRHTHADLSMGIFFGGKKRIYKAIYPLVNVYITMEHHNFNG